MDAPDETLSSVPPYLLAILLCDYIIVEEGSNKKTLVGLFERVFSGTFPVVQQLALYAKFTDAEGRYRLRMDYANLTTDQLLSSTDLGEGTALDRLGVGDLIVRVQVPIPEPGSYEFRLFANNSYLGRASFQADRVSQPGE